MENPNLTKSQHMKMTTDESVAIGKKAIFYILD